jgi:hypothetical protein
MFVAFEWVNPHFGKHGSPFFLFWNNKVQGLISLFVGHILKSINLLVGLKELMDIKSELKGPRRKILR